MKKFQQNSLQLFIKELPRFFLGIKYIRDNLPETDAKKTTLTNMVQEMEPILKQFHIICGDEKDRDEKISLERIVTVNNELRDVKIIIQWEENYSELMRIIDNLKEFTDIPPIEFDKDIEFGYSNISPEKFFYYIKNSTLNDTKNFNGEINFDNKLCQNGILGHLIFSLLSGYKIIIISNDIEKGINLAELLVNFIPLFHESDLQIIENSPYEIANNSFKIAIIKSADVDLSKNISILNLNDNFYQGLVCGPNSFVWQFAKIKKNVKIRSFSAISYYKLKSIADKFIRMSYVFLKNEFQNQHQFFLMLDSNKFKKDDFPVFIHWLNLIPAFKNILSLIGCSCWSHNIGTLWI